MNIPKHIAHAAIPIYKNPHTSTHIRERAIPKAVPSINAPEPTPSQITPPRQSAYGRYVSDEFAEPVECSIQGTVPSWVRGTYYKNGPGMFQDMQHLFSGYGMIQKLTFKGGKATYQRRFVNSEAYTQWRIKDSSNALQFGFSLPTLRYVTNMAKRIVGLGPGITDNACVTVRKLGNELVAATETVNGYIKLDPDSLDTLGPLEFDEQFLGIFVTAHEKFAPSGALINVWTDVSSKLYTVVRREAGSGVRTRIASISTPDDRPAAWVHDFGVTDDYVIIVDTPTFGKQFAGDMAGAQDFGLFVWNDSLPTWIHVTRVSTGEVFTYKAPPFFFFHVINAYEAAEQVTLDNGDTETIQWLVIDMPCFDTASPVASFYLNNLQAGVDLPHGYLQRLRVPINQSTQSAGARAIVQATCAPGYSVAIEKLVTDSAQHGSYSELPTINQSFTGKQYRFAYVECRDPEDRGSGAVCKIDAQSRSVCGVWRSNGGITGEPLFVGRPGSDVEDDGVVLCVVYDENGGMSCVVLNAQDMAQLASVSLPKPVTFQFHGSWDFER